MSTQLPRLLLSIAVCWNGDLVSCDAAGNVTSRQPCGAPCVSL